MLTLGDTAALDKVRLAFEGCPRPEHFTNFEHCDECAEHDQTLLAHDPDSLRIEDVGNPGWEPICHTAPDGFAYYVPGLARLVFSEPPYGYSWYGCLFLWHLISDGPANARYRHCSPEQRNAVAELVGHLIENRSEQLEAEFVADDAIHAYKIWNADEAV